MKVDTKLVAEGLANVERMLEEGVLFNEDGLGSSQLRIVIDCIAGAIKAEHPRFNVAHFQIDSTPISNERLKQAILAKLGGSSS